VQTNRILDYLSGTSAPGAVILIRFLTGSIFLSEGIQKFLYPADLGVGRFEKLGIIYPSISARFWKFAHEARTDYSMIMSLIFLLIVGAGSVSLDYTIIKKRSCSDANA
jgi:uncharacterized membrane protein YphA (DoxX/SURF4 family)